MIYQLFGIILYATGTHGACQIIQDGIKELKSYDDGTVSVDHMKKLQEKRPEAQRKFESGLKDAVERKGKKEQTGYSKAFGWYKDEYLAGQAFLKGQVHGREGSVCERWSRSKQIQDHYDNGYYPERGHYDGRNQFTKLPIRGTRNKQWYDIGYKNGDFEAKGFEDGRNEIPRKDLIVGNPQNMQWYDIRYENGKIKASRKFR